MQECENGFSFYFVCAQFPPEKKGVSGDKVNLNNWKSKRKKSAKGSFSTLQGSTHSQYFSGLPFSLDPDLDPDKNDRIRIRLCIKHFNNILYFHNPIFILIQLI